MTHMIRSNFADHAFYLVYPSPWPVLTSISLFILTNTAALSMHNFYSSYFLVYLGLFIVIFSVSFWFCDIISEATLLGDHTLVVQKGLNLGIILILVIVSEALFFMAIFWAFFHSALTPTVELIQYMTILSFLYFIFIVPIIRSLIKKIILYLLNIIKNINFISLFFIGLFSIIFIRPLFIDLFNSSPTEFKIISIILVILFLSFRFFIERDKCKFIVTLIIKSIFFIILFYIISFINFDWISLSFVYSFTLNYSLCIMEDEDINYLLSRMAESFGYPSGSDPTPPNYHFPVFDTDNNDNDNDFFSNWSPILYNVFNNNDPSLKSFLLEHYRATPGEGLVLSDRYKHISMDNDVFLYKDISINLQHLSALISNSNSNIEWFSQNIKFNILKEEYIAAILMERNSNSLIVNPLSHYFNLDFKDINSIIGLRARYLYLEYHTLYKAYLYCTYNVEHANYKEYYDYWQKRQIDGSYKTFQDLIANKPINRYISNYLDKSVYEAELKDNLIWVLLELDIYATIIKFLNNNYNIRDSESHTVNSKILLADLDQIFRKLIWKNEHIYILTRRDANTFNTIMEVSTETAKSILRGIPQKNLSPEVKSFIFEAPRLNESELKKPWSIGLKTKEQMMEFSYKKFVKIQYKTDIKYEVRPNENECD